MIAAVESVLFIGFTTLVYELYLQVRYPGPTMPGDSNYTLFRYAIVLSLGISAVTTFIAALVGSWK